MKNFFISMVFIIFPSLSFCQIDVKKMIEIYKMGTDKFENYCIINDWELNKYIKYIDVYEHEGTLYKKGSGTNTKYLCYYTKFGQEGPTLSYQISNPKEYLLFKKDLEISNYEIILSENKERLVNNIKQIVKEVNYVNFSNNYVFTINSVPNIKEENGSYRVEIILRTLKK